MSGYKRKGYTKFGFKKTLNKEGNHQNAVLHSFPKSITKVQPVTERIIIIDQPVNSIRTFQHDFLTVHPYLSR